MQITFIPVDLNHPGGVPALAVAHGQESFIETPAQCLAEARTFAQWRPVGIYADGNLAGFAMYGLWQNEGAHGRVWLDRFLIDGAYQHKGIGKTAFPLLLRRIVAEYACDTIYLSVTPENQVAARLYASFGFYFTGERDIHGEHVMVLQGAGAI